MRVLVLGASGMIGHAIWRHLTGAGLDVSGTLHGGRDRLARYGLFAHRAFEDIEAENTSAVEALLDRLGPTVIVNCLGITKRRPEAIDLGRMFRVNALFPHLLARWSQLHGARVIHFSTDCVFSGDAGAYTERSVASATDLYGQTKYFGELDYDHCLTLRTSMIGRELAGRTELLEWFLAQEGKTVFGFRKAWYSGLTTNEMARIVHRVIHQHPGLNGKYQVAGPAITKYALLSQVAEVFGMHVDLRPDDDFECDRTLKADRFEGATGIAVPSWQVMLTDLAADRSFYDRS